MFIHRLQQIAHQKCQKAFLVMGFTKSRITVTHMRCPVFVRKETRLKIAWRRADPPECPAAVAQSATRPTAPLFRLRPSPVQEMVECMMMIIMMHTLMSR